MAVFEGKSGSIVIDDTISLLCIIENAHTVHDHVEYMLRVQRGPSNDKSWHIQRRYNDFALLDGTLKACGLDLSLPPKKVFGNKDREFIAERQQGLQNYMNEVLKIHKVCNCLVVRNFLDPGNYNFNVTERALQHISMLFRSEPRWEVVEPAPDIGWRIRKAYFLVKDKTQPKMKYLLSWTRLGPFKGMDIKDVTSVSKILTALKHPYIYPMTMCEWNENCVISVSTFQDKGTVRDLICKAKPKQTFLKKYCKPKTYCICGIDSIRTYGRQILEALKFLHEKGIAYGHLHAGNVLVNDKVCQLMDVHSWFVGCPAYYKPFIVQHRKIQTTEEIDVYSFGHLIYEMSIGEPLNEAICDNATLNCPPEVRSVIQSILTADSCKNGMPSISDLLSHSLFSCVELHIVKPQLKIPSKLKECIKEAKSQFEKKIKDEQKVLHQHKRLSKAKEFHMSDDEKRKRRRSKIKQLSQQASEDQSNGTSAPLSSESPISPASPQSTNNTPQTDIVQNGGANIPAAPLPPPVSPPPPPPPQSAGNGVPFTTTGEGRLQLLGSIQNFSKTGLKKAETLDKSQPKV